MLLHIYWIDLQKGSIVTGQTAISIHVYDHPKTSLWIYQKH